MECLIEYICVILVSAAKMLVAPAVAYLYEFTYLETVITMSVGGIASVFFFVYFSEFLIYHWKKQCQKNNIYNKKASKKPGKIVKFILNKWGYMGMVSILPGILWIPITSFIIVRLYGRPFVSAVYMSVSVIVWAFILAYVFMLGFEFLGFP